MRKFLSVILLTITVICGTATTANAFRPAPGVEYPDQCTNVEGYQDMTSIFYGQYQFVGDGATLICEPGPRYVAPQPVFNPRNACRSTVKRHGVIYCRTGHGLRNPCRTTGGTFYQQDIAARACEQNRM